MAVRVVTDQAAIEVPVVASRRGILGTVGRGLARNRKALAGLALFGFFVLVALLAPVIAPYNPSALQFGQMLQPSARHLLGTTGTGQDIFSQLLFGTRESLLIAVGAGLGATLVSVIIGVSAAYLGGIWDHALNLFTDVFLVLPTLPLMIIIGTYLNNRGLLVLIGVIVITGWSYGARQLRSQALSLRNRDFLEAARARGEQSLYIIVFEVLPNMTSLIVAIFFGAALYAVLAAAGLQFIGLGDPNSLSWGTMLYWAQANGALLAGSPVWVLAPGFCIAALGAAFALINYAFDEISNPALRPVRRRGK
jgi:peptide/nickel transport system permease protein